MPLVRMTAKHVQEEDTPTNKVSPSARNALREHMVMAQDILHRLNVKTALQENMVVPVGYLLQLNAKIVPKEPMEVPTGLQFVQIAALDVMVRALDSQQIHNVPHVPEDVMVTTPDSQRRLNVRLVPKGLMVILLA